MEVVIVGAGGHGRDIAEDLGADFAGFYDDKLTGANVLGTLEDWRSDTRDFIVGVNDPQERDRIEQLHPGRQLNWIHRDASVGPDVNMGHGCHINAGVTITRAELGSFVTVSPGATICGDVVIGSRAVVGANATICNFGSVGAGAIVGAGSTVIPHQAVAPSQRVIGTPARPLGRWRQIEKELDATGRRHPSNFRVDL